MKHVYYIIPMGQAEDAWFARQSAASQEEVVWSGYTENHPSLPNDNREVSTQIKWTKQISLNLFGVGLL